MKLVVAFVLIALTSFAQDARPQQPRLPEGISAKRDIEYVPGGGKRRMLDVYYPEKAGKPVPLVVWIHGGAWSAGSKDRTPAISLLDQGFAVASVTYRFSQDAVFPAQIEDCKSAIRWLRKNAAQYNIDPEKIGVWGSSAGGHLVAMLGVSGDVKDWEKGENLDQSSRVQAVCDWFGPSNLLTFGPQGGNDRPNGARPFPATDAADSPEGKLIGGAHRARRQRSARPACAEQGIARASRENRRDFKAHHFTRRGTRRTAVQFARNDVAGGGVLREDAEEIVPIFSRRVPSPTVA